MRMQCGCEVEVVVMPVAYCNKHKMADDLIEAVDGLLNGLDANTDGRDGLTQKQWDDRITYAREVFNKATGL